METEDNAEAQQLERLVLEAASQPVEADFAERNALDTREDDRPGPVGPITEESRVAVAHALRAVANGSLDEAILAGRRPVEAIWSVLLEVVQPDLNDALAVSLLEAHPLISRELDRQDRDVRDLHRGAREAVLERARNEAVVTPGDLTPTG